METVLRTRDPDRAATAMLTEQIVLAPLEMQLTDEC